MRHTFFTIKTALATAKARLVPLGFAAAALASILGGYGRP